MICSCLPLSLLQSLQSYVFTIMSVCYCVISSLRYLSVSYCRNYGHDLVSHFPPSTLCLHHMSLCLLLSLLMSRTYLVFHFRFCVLCLHYYVSLSPTAIGNVADLSSFPLCFFRLMFTLLYFSRSPTVTVNVENSSCFLLPFFRLTFTQICLSVSI